MNRREFSGVLAGAAATAALAPRSQAALSEAPAVKACRNTCWARSSASAGSRHSRITVHRERDHGCFRGLAQRGAGQAPQEIAQPRLAAPHQFAEGRGAGHGLP
jgi:hypothetical protein